MEQEVLENEAGDQGRWKHKLIKQGRKIERITHPEFVNRTVHHGKA